MNQRKSFNREAVETFMTAVASAILKLDEVSIDERTTEATLLRIDSDIF